MPGTFPHSHEPIPPPPPWWQVVLMALAFALSGFVIPYLTIPLFWPRGM